MIRRATEGGAFVGLSSDEIVERATAIVGVVPDGLVFSTGWAHAAKNGLRLLRKLGSLDTVRVYLAEKVKP